MRGQPAAAWALVLALMLAGTACGDDDDTQTASATSTSAAPTTAVTAATSSSTSASQIPPTTPFTYPARPTAPFVPGDGTLTASGDITASARFSSSSCGGISVTEPRGVLASLVFVTDDSRSLVLDVAGVSPGQTNLPEPAGFNQVPPRRFRLSVDSAGDVLTWGTTAAGEGSVSGSLTVRAPNGRSGSFELQLGFTGNERSTLAPGSRGPVRVSGSWACPS